MWNSFRALPSRLTLILLCPYVSDVFVLVNQNTWTFMASNRAERDEWITALVHAIQKTDHTATPDGADVVSKTEAFAVEADNVSVDTVLRSDVFPRPRWVS